MAYGQSESARDSFGKFNNQFQPKIKSLVWETWKDINKIILNRQNVFII